MRLSTFLLLTLCGCNCSTATMSGSEVCDNQRDEDLDGLIDCADSDCFGDRACFSQCLDTCEQGTGLCDLQGARTCARDVASGCLTLSSPFACEGGTGCSAGACLPPPCTSQCTLSTKQCAALGLAVRCETLATGCTDWVIDTTCGAEQVCFQGACVPRDECRPLCTAGATRCRTDGRQETCVGNSACSDWGIAASSSACARDAGAVDAGVDAGQPRCGGDAGCAAFPISVGDHTQWAAHVAAGPNQFLVTWGDYDVSQVLARTVDATTGAMSPILIVSSGQDLSWPVWNGVDYAVYCTRRGTQLQRVSTSAALVGDAGSAGEANGYNGTIAFNGTSYLASYFWPASVRVLGLDGNPTGTQPTVLAQYTSSGNSGYAAVATDGTDFAVAYYEPHLGDVYDEDAWFQRVAADGGMVGPRVLLAGDAGQQYQTSLAYGGGTWLAAWYDLNPALSQIHARALDRLGVPLGTDLFLSSGQSSDAWTPNVLWTGTDFLVTWYESSGGVFGARVSAGGQVTQPRFNLNPSGGDPSVAVIGHRGLMVYGDRACDAGVCGRFIDL